MDPSVLINDAFWSDPSPVAMVAPGGASPDLTEAPGQVFFQTSGSTAAPRWVGLSRQALQASAKAVNEHLEVVAESCWGLLLPLHHVGGFGVAARAYQAACRLAVGEGKWDPQAATAWLDREQVTHTSMVPTQVHDLVQSGMRAPDSLTAVVVGGGGLDDSVGKAARALGWPVLASYGMTEAGSQIATQGLQALDADFHAAPIPVLPHWQVRLAEDGRLEIAGKALFDGWLVVEDGVWKYQKRPGQWFLSSDLVELDGTQLTPLGRADLLVKVLGELVDLGAIEQEIISLAEGGLDPASLVVLALPDERSGHRLVPVADARLDEQMVTRAIERYTTRAPGYARLQPLVMLENFPRSALGKPARSACAARIC